MSWKCRGITKDGNNTRQHDECVIYSKFCPECGLSQNEAWSLSSPMSFSIKVLTSLPFSLLIAGLILAGIYQISQSQKHILSYKSNRYGIGLDYPASWGLRTPQQDFPPNSFSATKDLFQLLAPDQGQGDYQENILVKIEVANTISYLDEYADTQIARIQQIGTYIIESDQAIVLDSGYNVREVIYSGNNGMAYLKMKRIIAEPQLQQDYFILITYIADREDYDIYLFDAEKIFQSIELL